MTTARIKWSENRHPFSLEFGDIYFSSDDPIGESQHVFINGNQLSARFTAMHPGEKFSIGECGFGTGLNFLCALVEFLEHAPAGCQLYYLGLELSPIDKQQLTEIHQLWPELASYSQYLLDQYSSEPAKDRRLKFYFKTHYVTLDLVIGDAGESLKDRNTAYAQQIDAWFMDGFTPTRNPELWSAELVENMRACSKQNSTVATYSVSRSVRDTLSANDYEVKKLKGFGRKRHMLSATLSVPDNHKQINWYSPPQRNNFSKQAIIIGAGLSGCCSARALADRGWHVTIIDKAESIADGASGNLCGIVYPPLGHQDSPLYRLHQAGFHYSVNVFNSMASQHQVDWEQCGVLQLNDTASQHKQFASPLYKLQDSEQCSSMAGFTTGSDGYFCSLAGRISPQKLCHALLHHPYINIKTGLEARNVEHHAGQWAITFSNKAEKLSSPVLVLCNSYNAADLLAENTYPLIPNKGQVDYYLTSASNFPETVVCSKAYIVPLEPGLAGIGGSFDTDNINPESSKLLTRKNQDLVSKYFPPFMTTLIDKEPSASWAGVRCTSPDYFPLVGGVEDRPANIDIFSAWKRNARARINHPASYRPGLFINTCHGSHGLSRIPLLSEYLAAMINNDPLPLPDSLIQQVHPMRFLVRSLKKQDL